MFSLVGMCMCMHKMNVITSTINTAAEYCWMRCMIDSWRVVASSPVSPICFNALKQIRETGDEARRVALVYYNLITMPFQAGGGGGGGGAGDEANVC